MPFLYTRRIRHASEKYELSSTHLYYSIGKQVRALDLKTLRSARFGPLNRLVPRQMYTVQGKLLVVTYEKAVMLDQNGKKLWERVSTLLGNWRTSSDKLFRGHSQGFVQIDTETGNKMTWYPCQSWCVFDKGVLFRTQDGLHWLDAKGVVGTAVPPAISARVLDHGNQSFYTRDGSEIHVQDSQLVWRRAGRPEKHWTLPNDILIYGGRTMGDQLILCHGAPWRNAPTAQRLPPLPGMHFRYNGLAYAQYSVQILHGILYLYDHGFRPIRILIGLAPLLPYDLVRLIMEYA